MAVSYRKCPKCGHEGPDAETAPEGACPACGLIFEKYLKTRYAALNASAATDRSDADRPALLMQVRALLFHVPEDVESLYVYGRAALLAVLVVYGAKLAAMDVPS